ncbi:serine carboxypeptidase [Truncatella angustata]|uniref:Serine carboxypeptidase n=1 Tax=Truncatella angustata TaxID=152316 RepID=A0A9P8RJH0_9PEZI|nr:serine carboxypeptidase [Truncatella angustata]KAH6639940.1 serine carboxypeptidase [Truncatella angustata]
MMLKQLVWGSLLSVAVAQFPPEPKGITVLKSKFHENVTISYKEASQICETTPGVKSYSGYVHLPAGLLDDTGEVQNYPINTFFWFFESRIDPHNAPLAIWLNGGPGGSSMMGLLEENGPCFVGPDSKSTYLNPWSWNNEVNMLYLDQPTQVGFSYDIPTNGTLRLIEEDEASWETVASDFTDGVPLSNFTHRVGTFSSQDLERTANTTAFAAHALWHFAQTWFFEFPAYKPNDNRISLWAESYGGHYGPGIFRFFQQQNEKIANGSSPEENAHYIHLDTLGIVNGLIDMLIAGESYISYAYNNTYGIQAFNQSAHDYLMHQWIKPGGCKEGLAACQEALKARDGYNSSSNGEDWREICGAMNGSCGFGESVSMYQNSGHGWYDIAHPKEDPFPAPYMYGYLTQESVLEALGVPVNYSEHSDAVGTKFQETFDIYHGGFLEAIGYLLDTGVKVHMMYGDRDYACNWVGGEASSLAVPYSRRSDFAEAGYAPLLTPGGHSGFTRQFGNFSFSRVFQSGHEVPSYQPAAAWSIFNRATFGLDIPTGLAATTDEFATEGPHNTWDVKNEVPEWPEARCNVLKPGTCVPELLEKMKQGKVVVEDFFVVGVIEDEEEDGRTAPVVDAGQDRQQVIGEL